jgi:hypothetical protein
VARGSVTVSLWVDGNRQARRRLRHDARRQRADWSRRVVSREVIESEFLQAGFRARKHFDVLPGWSMWRLYLLDRV